MRTTINLDDDVLAELKTYAEYRELPLGKAVSELVRKGLHAPVKTRLVSGFHVADLPADSPQVTSALVRRIEEEVE